MTIMVLAVIKTHTNRDTAQLSVVINSKYINSGFLMQSDNVVELLPNI